MMNTEQNLRFKIASEEWEFERIHQLNYKIDFDCIGRTFEHEGAVVVPLPHPSGASSWLNAPANRELAAAAARLVRVELARL